MKITPSRLLAVILWLLSGALSGCIGKNVPEVTYYSLLTIRQMGEVEAAQTGPPLQLGIGPVTIPDVLKRSQIVTRDNRNVYRFDEFHRWAGILEQDITYLLGDNLGDLLGSEQIAFFPWGRHFTPSHRVLVQILRLDGDFSREAVLSVLWTVTDAEGEKSLASGKSFYRKPVGAEFDDLVRAESRLLADFSRDLAEHLRTLP